MLDSFQGENPGTSDPPLESAPDQVVRVIVCGAWITHCSVSPGLVIVAFRDIHIYVNADEL